MSSRDYTKQCVALQLNPMHAVPVLQDGDLVLVESRAILAYLADQYGKGKDLYPKDAKARAKVDSRLYFDAGTFYAAAMEAVVSALQ